MATQQAVKVLNVWECSCGVTYGVTQEFVAARRLDGRRFYCPNGCRLSYDSEYEKTKKRLAKMTHCCDQKTARVRELDQRTEHLEHRISGYKGALVSQRKRLTATTEEDEAE